jgi:hypothetical protein
MVSLNPALREVRNIKKSQTLRMTFLRRVLTKKHPEQVGAYWTQSWASPICVQQIEKAQTLEDHDFVRVLTKNILNKLAMVIWAHPRGMTLPRCRCQ